MNSVPVVTLGTVIDVNDISGGDRIKVVMHPVDDYKNISSQICEAFPLLPKIFHVKPKLSETVLVMTANAMDKNSQRYYIGPVISQMNYLYSDNVKEHATSLLKGGDKNALSENPQMNPDTIGAFPNNEDITIEGRKDASLQLKDDEALVKVGVKLTDDYDTSKITFNRKDPAYIKLKRHKKVGKNAFLGDDNYKSTATIVADKINLIGNNPKYGEDNDLSNISTTSVKKDTNGKITDDLITDADMETLIKKAHRLPYGDLLIDFLKTFTSVFLNHTHPFSMLKPDQEQCRELIEKTNSYLNNEKMLSDNIRIN